MRSWHKWGEWCHVLAREEQVSSGTVGTRCWGMEFLAHPLVSWRQYAAAVNSRRGSNTLTHSDRLGNAHTHIHVHPNTSRSCMLCTFAVRYIWKTKILIYWKEREIGLSCIQYVCLCEHELCKGYLKTTFWHYKHCSLPCSLTHSLTHPLCLFFSYSFKNTHTHTHIN